MGPKEDGCSSRNSSNGAADPWLRLCGMVRKRKIEKKIKDSGPYCSKADDAPDAGGGAHDVAEQCAGAAADLDGGVQRCEADDAPDAGGGAHDLER